MCACTALLEEVFGIHGRVDEVTETGRFEVGDRGSSGLLEEVFALSYTPP
jgi:hypothetical protein